MSWEFQKRSATRLFWDKYPEEYKQEIIGIADGVNARLGREEVDFKDILTLNEMYESLSRFRTYFVYPFRLRYNWLIRGILYLQSKGSCSAFIATGNYTKDGRIVAAHSTRAYAAKDMWWHIYVAERYNVILDINPTKGYRFLMSTSPGYIWSGEDFYQNSAGIILMETTLDPLGRWTRRGDPVVVRARRAIQYSDSIDEVINHLLEKNNGLMPNDWIIGDTKSGEIASLELALRNYGLRRTKDGFIWSCNNVRDDKVRWELNSILGLGILGRFIRREFEPTERDLKFSELKNAGRVDVHFAKKIMSTYPISEKMFDCKITDTQLVNNLGLWCFMGNPDGSDFIAEEYPFKTPKEGYTDLPASGWVEIYGLSFPNKHRCKTFQEGDDGNLLWEYKAKEGIFGNAIYSSPEIARGKLYISSWNGNIMVLDLNSSRVVWEERVGWSSTSSPLVFNDSVFVGHSDGLSLLKQGKLLWKKEIGTVSCKPTIGEGIIYFGSHDTHVYALDKKNIKWKFKTKGEVCSSPVLYKGILYVGSKDGNLYALDATTGSKKWSYKTGAPICSSPLIYKNVIFFGSWDNNLYALNLDGSLKWKFTCGWGIHSSPSIRDDTLYFASLDGNFYALDPENGSLKWFFSARAGIRSSPLAYGDLVFFGSDDGRIYALHAKSGKVIWKHAPDYYIKDIYNYKTRPLSSSPVAFNGRVYIGSTNGRIYVYDAKTREEKRALEGVPFETWLFLFLSLLSIVLVTTAYLYFSWKMYK
jgi:outer membrane protein assembly factor BamB